MRILIKIIPIVFIFIASNIQAQYGFRAGVNLPNVSANYDFIEPENKIGFSVGAFLDVINIDGVQITSNLTYTSKTISGNYGYQNAVLGRETDMSVNYLIYSLSGKYNFLDNKAEVNPFIFFAPRLNIYVSSKYDEGIYNFPEYSEEIVSDKITKFGLGISIGAGFDVKTKSSLAPFFEVQISPDFFDAYDDGTRYTFKSNAIEAMVGIRIK